MATISPRLDLNEAIVLRAKRAYAKRKGLDDNVDLEDIPFSETAALAVQYYGPKIVEHLENAGLGRDVIDNIRPRRIRDELWKQLKQWAKEYDTKQISLLRAAIKLLAAELDDKSGKNETRQRKSKK